MKRLLPLLLLLVSSAGLAESGAYRIEVIAFLNPPTETIPIDVVELHSFSKFPDISEISPREENPPPTSNGSDGQATTLIAQFPPDNLPDDVNLIRKRTLQMDGVWRRLRSSESYRPLLYAAWEQNRVDYYPPMRIHDQNIIDTQLRPPTQVMVADLTATDPLAAYRSTFFRLDGSVQLRRSRFLHLFLDLEYRLENTNPLALNGTFEDIDMQRLAGDGEPESTQVYKLVQNRQISTGEMQYFDTPYFGALVLVTAISDESGHANKSAP